MPLIGGEIARAAFEHGFEEYGVDQLLKYETLTANGESFLWYFPDGQHATVETSTSPDAMPTDGWGSSSMLYALVEGLAGIVDTHKLFRKVRLSPRWVAAGLTSVDAGAHYEVSGSGFGYHFGHDEGKRQIRLELSGRADVNLHLMLPGAARARRVRVNGKSVRHTNKAVRNSRYVDATFGVTTKAVVEVEY